MGEKSPSLSFGSFSKMLISEIKKNFTNSLGLYIKEFE
jgi:hypothetical protein